MRKAAAESGEALSRRQFTRLAAFGGTTAWLAGQVQARADSSHLPLPGSPDETYWASIRRQFILDDELAVMNAANLCPSSKPALEVLEHVTRSIDRDPSPQNRAAMSAGREETRKKLAGFLRASPEEILITRNTSESNNMVSSGLDLKQGEEVVIFSDNHPSNHQAWTEKARRFGFTVRIIDQPNPHPGAQYYIEAFNNAVTAKTRILAFSHLTNTVGDLLPADELCAAAREREVLTLVDGAQTFGLMDLDLGSMKPDFYTGSAHKWPCGPKEAGVLYVNRKSQSNLRSTLYSVYPGATQLAVSFEALGQRDDAAIMAFGAALDFQSRIGKGAIEKRARELAAALMEGLRKMEGVVLWTNPAPDRSVAVVAFQPGSLDPAKLAAALYEKDRIGCAVRSGTDRGGLRFSPHLYNSLAEVERILAALRRHMSAGI